MSIKNGKNVTKLRLAKNLSQAALGLKVGLSGARISQIEQGGTPRLDKVGLLAKALGSTVADVFGSRIASAAEGVKQNKTVQTRSSPKPKPVVAKSTRKSARTTKSPTTSTRRRQPVAEAEQIAA